MNGINITSRVDGRHFIKGEVEETNRAKVVALPQPSIAPSLAILGTLRESASQLNDRHNPTIDLPLIQAIAPPQENKSCKREKTRWKTCLRRLKTMCKKVKRTFKASGNVWERFEIHKFF